VKQRPEEVEEKEDPEEEDIEYKSTFNQYLKSLRQSQSQLLQEERKELRELEESYTAIRPDFKSSCFVSQPKREVQI